MTLPQSPFHLLFMSLACLHQALDQALVHDGAGDAAGLKLIHIISALHLLGKTSLSVLQEPLQNAARGENVSSANPFASLLQPPQGQAGAAAAGAAATSEAPAASATPNTAPLPNPWAPNAGSDSSVATSTALPAAGLPAGVLSWLSNGTNAQL